MILLESSAGFSLFRVKLHPHMQLTPKSFKGLSGACVKQKSKCLQLLTVRVSEFITEAENNVVIVYLSMCLHFDMSLRDSS